MGFLGESKAPTVARMVHATAVAIGGLLAVDSGIEKRGGDKMVSRFPDGLGAIGVEGAVFVLLFLTVLVAWDGGALPSASGARCLNFSSCESKSFHNDGKVGPILAHGFLFTSP